MDAKCAKCEKDFNWDDAFTQQDTPGAYEFSPPGHGNWRPRLFCPHCGSLVLDWDIDHTKDRDQWKWYGGQEAVNQGKKFPGSPLQLVGRPLKVDHRVRMGNEQLDVSTAKTLFD